MPGALGRSQTIRCGPRRDRAGAAWAAGQALAVSPVPHAELTAIVEQGDVAIASILLSGLSASKRDDRLELVEAALTKFPEDKSVLRVARETLRTLEVQKVAGASSLLESLPASSDDAY